MVRTGGQRGQGAPVLHALCSRALVIHALVLHALVRGARSSADLRGGGRVLGW